MDKEPHQFVAQSSFLDSSIEEPIIDIGDKVIIPPITPGTT